MFELEISRNVSAAHQLRGYNGACCNLHGHNYEIIAVLQAKELDSIGIAVDFKKLKAVVDELILPYDHAFLNELPDYAVLNPTSENMAKTLYSKLAEKLNDGNVRVKTVKVKESAGSCASYFED